jgi:hypothetical protein
MTLDRHDGFGVPSGGVPCRSFALPLRGRLVRLTTALGAEAAAPGDIRYP